MSIKAVKANKQYTIDETAKASYLAQGFDIIDDSGAVIERSPQAAVPYSDYEQLLEENEALKLENEKLKSGSAQDEKKTAKKG